MVMDPGAFPRYLELLFEAPLFDKPLWWHQTAMSNIPYWIVIPVYEMICFDCKFDHFSHNVISWTMRLTYINQAITKVLLPANKLPYLVSKYW